MFSILNILMQKFVRSKPLNFSPAETLYTVLLYIGESGEQNTEE